MIDPGQLKIGRDLTQVLSIPNLGSGVALIMVDRISRVGGIAHIMLPDSSIESDPHAINDPTMKGKYANIAVAELFKGMQTYGSKAQSIQVTMAGAAQVFNFGGKGGNPLNVGARNSIAVRSALSKLGLVLEKAEMGGNKARVVELKVSTGDLNIKFVGNLF